MGAAKLLALTAADQDVTAKDGVLENEKLIVKFGENGEIVSIFDKEAQKETLEEAANKFKLYDDTHGISASTIWKRTPKPCSSFLRSFM